jgi:hypothetical protein
MSSSGGALIYFPFSDSIEPITRLLNSPYVGVNVSDGVSLQEAQHISDNYDLMFVGCGGLTAVSDGGDRWILHGNIGIAGSPLEGSYILKNSGKIVSTIGPSLDPPRP